MLGQQHYKPKYNGRLCYTQPPIYVEKNMIYDSTKELLSIAIKEYDKLAGKEFLIGCSISKNHDTEYLVLQINRHNFWHLLGCQLDKSKLKERSLDIYDMCIKGEPIQEYLIYTKDYASSTQKKDPFLSVFNFVEKAKQIRISNTKDTPDYCKFKLVHGNACGIIGYDNDKNTKDPNTYIPKTTQNKASQSFNNDNKRILFILSRMIQEHIFTKLEYEATPGLYMKLAANVPSKYKINLPSITFHDNGGFGGPGEVIWVIGSKQKPIAPRKEEYSFIGWNTKQDGSGTAWPPNNVVPFEATDYYAQWKKR